MNAADQQTAAEVAKAVAPYAMKLIRSGDGKLVAGPFKQTVQHTALNAEQKLEEAVRKLTVELRGAVDR